MHHYVIASRAHARQNYVEVMHGVIEASRTVVMVDGHVAGVQNVTNGSGQLQQRQINTVTCDWRRYIPLEE